MNPRFLSLLYHQIFFLCGLVQGKVYSHVCLLPPRSRTSGRLIQSMVNALRTFWRSTSRYVMCVTCDVTVPLLLYSSCDLYSMSRKLDHVLILNWPVTYVCHNTYQLLLFFCLCCFLPEIYSCVILRRTPYLESWPLFDYDYAQRSDNCNHTLCLKFLPALRSVGASCSVAVEVLVLSWTASKLGS